jgi:hypothetical protein
MVRDDDAIGAKAHRVAGVVRVEDALDDGFALPALADPFQIVPTDGGIESPPRKSL